MDMKDLGERVAKARDLAGQSQVALGDSVGLDRSAISRLEQGERKLSVPELVRIAQALGRPLSFFVSDPVPAVVNRRRDSEHAHDTNGLLDEELRSFSSDLHGLLRIGVLSGIDRDAISFRVPHTHEEAEQSATRVRSQAGLTIEPIEDLGRFCESLGLVTYSASLTELGPDGGCVEVGEDGSQLGAAVINGDSRPGRRRMTLAHELGHWLTGDAYDHESSRDSERMLSSFAIHLLAPRNGISRVWNEHSNWTTRDRAIAVSSGFRLSWSAAVLQLCNLGYITHDERVLLSQDVPTIGEFARLELATTRAIADDLASPYLSPGSVARMLEAYAVGDLTAPRTLELLRGTLRAGDLPPTEPSRPEDLRHVFAGHGA
ncbi:MAG: helix-turn-helix domain-containing protein [Actinobacteria bacterium]|nr:helix-turn-helix domain-containing protein [Actinomycetota bacterium]MCG2803259.1 XRE family transcriptional regulator [Cellulomonas sp.]